MKFNVDVKEVHTLTVEIEANSVDDAREKVSMALAKADESIVEYWNLVYSHTLPQTEWPTTEVKPE